MDIEENQKQLAVAKNNAGDSGALQLLGLHPIAAVAVTAIDSMLFGVNAATLGVTWVASIPIGAAVGVGVYFIQKGTYADDWMLAAGKGIMVSALTAIPTPIPAALSVGAGVLGTVKTLRMRKK